MKRKSRLLPLLLLFLAACRSYDISTLIFQEDLKRQIAAGNLRFRIEEEQIPYVSDLLLDEDPLVRLAALNIMENNRYDDFLFPILETTLDEDDRVNKEAFRILEDHPDWTRLFLEENLETMGDHLCLNALQILSAIGEVASREAIVELFHSESDRKKNGAAKVLAGKVALENPLMDELKNSEDPSYRAGYYRIVGHYGEPTLIPLLFEGISDESPDVWGACISSIYQFGEEAFPFVDRYIRSGDYLMSLSCLQILEAVKSEASLPLLISFYADSNRLLAQKAAIIVQSYGEAAVPFLGKGIMDGEDYNNRLILWTLREINSPAALPLYLTLLDLKDPVLEEDLQLSLLSLGEGVREELRNHVQNADPHVAVTLVALLVREGDPLIIKDDACSFYLISAVEEDLFDGYFSLAGIDRETEQDFRDLKRVLELRGILSESFSGENRYFQGYREILELENEANRAMESALKMRRQAMGGDEEGALREAGDRYRRIYEELDGRIQNREAALARLPLSEQKEGEELIFRYLDAREEVVDIWTGISPRYRSLARLVFNELDDDIEDIIKDVSRGSF